MCWVFFNNNGSTSSQPILAPTLGLRRKKRTPADPLHGHLFWGHPNPPFRPLLAPSPAGVVGSPYSTVFFPARRSSSSRGALLLPNARRPSFAALRRSPFPPLALGCSPSLPAPPRPNPRSLPYSFGLSATNQQYFSLTTNQPSATSQQYFSLRTNQHQPPAKRTDNVSPTVRRPLCAASLHHLASSPSATGLQDSESVAAASDLLVDG
jgi:hypothetical protein